jgi:hypothetical protein
MLTIELEIYNRKASTAKQTKYQQLLKNVMLRGVSVTYVHPFPSPFCIVYITDMHHNSTPSISIASPVGLKRGTYARSIIVNGSSKSMFPCPFHPYLIKLRHAQFIDMAVNYSTAPTKSNPKLKLLTEVFRARYCLSLYCTYTSYTCNFSCSVLKSFQSCF